MRHRRRPARLLWGDAQTLRTLSASQLTVHAVLSSARVESQAGRRERHLHHTDFSPLPYVAVVTTARVLFAEVQSDGGVDATAGSPSPHRLCWTVPLRRGDASSPTDRFRALRKGVADALRLLAPRVVASAPGQEDAAFATIAEAEAHVTWCFTTINALPPQTTVRGDTSGVGVPVAPGMPDDMIVLL